ncbi:unnamed protein product [Clonostachys rosea]|uniref:F-box domain-containing protein n=1 Tax=Bionectria ochroleuca TaxID=29856 RepID=A0ABY6TR07_BIOOC|nr:unnamed protein product [Clonostachys rosea]
MPSDSPTSDGLILQLPTELLSDIIRLVLVDISTDKSTGRYPPHYTEGRNRAQASATRTLLSLLREAANLFLYRTIVLRAIPLGSAKKTPAIDTSIITLSLFLRTLLERPYLTSHVLHIECQFFLRLESALSPETPPEHLQSLRRKSAKIYKQAIQGKRSLSGSNASVLDFVACSGDEAPSDLGERCFAAILCLLPNIQSLALPPLPRPEWCVTGWVDDVGGQTDDDASDWGDEDVINGEYQMLNSLLGLLREYDSVSSQILHRLRHLRFTYCPDYIPDNYSNMREGLLSLAVGSPRYTFRISACLSLLRCPNLREVVIYSLGTLKDFHGILPPLNCAPGYKFQKLHLITSSSTELALAKISSTLRLSELTVTCPDHAPTTKDRDKRAVSGRSGGYTGPSLWESALTKLGENLVSLDLHSVCTSRNMENIHLACLNSMVKLENLSICLSLVNPVEKFQSRPLHTILPPALKSLDLYDWTDYPSSDMVEQLTKLDLFTARELRGYVSPRDVFLVYKRALADILRTFGLACKASHPSLQSLWVFAFKPEPRTSLFENPWPMEGIIPDQKDIECVFKANEVKFQAYELESSESSPFRDAYAEVYE